MTKNPEAQEVTQVYEIGYLLLPSINEDQVLETVAKLKALVAKAGGVEIDGEAPFRYPLSYNMTKVVGASRYVVNEAYIGWMKFEVEPAQVLEIKAAVEKIEEVLRSLLLKVPRETRFSFAKAKALIAEKEAQRLSEEEAANDVVATDEVANGSPVEAVVE